jgi:hypothetical protein
LLIASRMSGMTMLEVSPGRFRVELGGGLGLELVMLFSRSFAFWRWDGALVREAHVGEG